MQKSVIWFALAVVCALASCGGADEAGSGDPLTDALADQLGVDAGGGWFNALDRAEVECFATATLDTLSEQRQAELRFTIDNIPLLFEADWTDSEIDALTDTFDTCVNDNAKATEAFLWTILGPQVDRYSDCAVSEITATSGERYWVERFSASFVPPRVEAALQDDPEAQSVRTMTDVFPELEPVFEECVPGYGDPIEYAEDACGGEPCEDEPDLGDLRRVVLECSRDPYVYASFYVSPEDPGFFGPEDPSGFLTNSACEGDGRGTLIGAQLFAYPCPGGPRDVELNAAGEPITEQAIVDACANVP